MSEPIAIDLLLLHPDNPPSRRQPDPELVASLRAGGQLQALLVEPGGDGRYLVIDGNRRLLAARAAARTRMACTVRPRTDRLQHTIDRLAANGHRRGLAPLEEAHDFGRLRAAGLTVAQIVTRTGFPAATVRTRLDLLQLDDATQQLVTDKHLTLGAALDAVRQAAPTSTRASRPRSKPRAPEWFGAAHPLAGDAGRRCREAHQRVARKLGGIACGEHWEAAIRADAAPTGWTGDAVADLLNDLRLGAVGAVEVAR